MVYPVNDARGVLDDPQLSERTFWRQIEHPHLHEVFSYPGPFIKTEEGLCEVRGRAPMVGEHNEDVYGNELGISEEDQTRLKAEWII